MAHSDSRLPDDLNELAQYILTLHQHDLRIEFSLSFKTDEHLHVLSCHSDSEGFPGGEILRYSRGDIRAALESKTFDEAHDFPKSQPTPQERYSSNFFFAVLLHELLEQSLILFTRSTVMLGIACARAGRQAVERMREGALWIPFFTADEILVAEAVKRIKKFEAFSNKNPDAIVYQNEGICFAAETQEGMKQRIESFHQKAKGLGWREPDFSTVEFDPERAAEIAPAVRMLLKTDQPGSIAVFHTNSELMKYICGGACFKRIAFPVVLEQIAVCNAYPAFIPYKADLNDQFTEIRKGIEYFSRMHGFAPLIVVVEKVGLFSWGQNKKSADRCRDVFLNSLRIAAYAEILGGTRPLPKLVVRKALEKNCGRSLGNRETSEKNERFIERIAIVTGAAQGIGAGIAEKLAGEGAYVVLADLDEKKAEERAEEICRVSGSRKTSSRAVDVGKEPSIKALIIATVLEYGGLDIFISNAGIVRAGSIEDVDTVVFDHVTQVNYTAFFLCCKHASWIMKIQHRFQRSRYADIVLINSKTGLVGSKRNFAYAGSKFGGIGLVQSFALELADSNIKVNAICPGNYLEGPLWSDPTNGLLVQYLRAEKVTGARNVEDVRRYYENEMPMKRGCKIEDIFRAVAYVIEQEYETGQALPVTGGQMMLK